MSYKKIPPQESLPQNPNFPKNKSGETYGSMRDVSPYEKGPDLIKTIGVNGKQGYIRNSEAHGEIPRSPEEALAKQAKREIIVINVYESDGKTVLDKFEIKPINKEKREERTKKMVQYMKQNMQNK